MKKITILLAIIACASISCKKDDPEPEPETKTVTQTITNTVTVIQHDTVYCMPKSEIIQGTWYCYKWGFNGSTSLYTPSQVVTFNPTNFTWDGSTSGTISYSSNYSNIISSGNIAYTIVVSNCTELRLTNNTNQYYFLRRTP